MNPLFRIATRALCFGLLAALSLVLVVSAQGIRPEVLVTFKPAFQTRDAETLLAAAPVVPQPPEQFAQVEPATRLDSPSTNRIAANGNARSVKTPKLKFDKAFHPVKPQPQTEPELPQLPPVPEPVSDVSVEEGDQPVEPSSELAAEGSPVEAEMLSAPETNPEPPTVATEEDKAAFESEPVAAAPQESTAPDTNVAEFPDSNATSTQLAEPPPKPAADPSPEVQKAAEVPQKPTSRRLTNPALQPSPTFGTSSIKRYIAKSDARQGARSEDKSVPEATPTAPITTNVPGLEERLEALQRQLTTLTTEQEQQRLSYQTWLEQSQSQQQQQLKTHLEGIEATLRELKNRSVQEPPKSGPSEPYIQRADGKGRRTVNSSTPVIREERPDADGARRFSIESHQTGVRELLDALAQKANLNVVLAINVEGDVEMSLQNATTEQALEAIQKSTGYVVEKSGQKVYIRPAEPKRHQRDEFLPPIVKQESEPAPVTAP